MKWPSKLIGTIPLASWLNSLLESAQSTQIKPGVGYIIHSQSLNGTVLEITSRNSSSRPWQTPNKELDPTVAVSKGTWVYISPNNPLVTTGLTDLAAGTILQSPPGIWEAAQNVPAQVTVGGVIKYNVPQLPTEGTPSGTPLAGDLDASTLFWIRIQEYSPC
jgi:hypothetical protein